MSQIPAFLFKTIVIHYVCAKLPGNKHMHMYMYGKVHAKYMLRIMRMDPSYKNVSNKNYI